MIIGKQTIGKLLLVALTTLAAGAASALTYPERSIRLIVPFPPGGGTDQIARAIATSITATHGWSIVVENKPGAGGNVGLNTVAHSAPDGHTVLLSQTENVVLNPLLYSKLTYDPIKDFTPIGLIARASLALVVRADSPYQTLADVVAAAKERPGTLTFGTSGIGSTPQLAQQLWERASGASFTHVPYRGASAAVPDLIGGQITLYAASIPTLRAHVDNGSLRAIGVTSERRLPAMKQVPTFIEAGYKDVEISTLWGVMAPTGTPDEVIESWTPLALLSAGQCRTGSFLDVAV